MSANKRDFVYLDNAATTWPKPPEVPEAVADCVARCANPGRAAHRLSTAAQDILEDTRALLARVFNAHSPHHAIFTLNGTDSLNIALKGLVKHGSRVITGPYEHNSVMRPLLHMKAERRLRITSVRPDGRFGIDLAHFQELCREGADVVVVSHASNVTGQLLPLDQMAPLVHAAGGIFVVDAAQTAGKTAIDLQRTGVDVLAAPGHKGLYGPMGVGILILGRDLDIAPLREGGAGQYSEDEMHPRELPWRLEAGSVNLPAIAGLAAGLRFVMKKGTDYIGTQERMLSAFLAEGLATIPGVGVLAGPPETNAGIVSFTMEDYDPAILGILLDQQFDLGVRTGLHCSPAAHRTIDTFPEGTVRVSFGCFNEPEDILRLVDALKAIAAK